MNSTQFPCYLIERCITVSHDSPTIGCSQETSDETAHGPFDFQREYDGKRNELMSKRLEDGWERPEKNGAALERRGGGEIAYFARGTARKVDDAWSFDW